MENMLAILNAGKPGPGLLDFSCYLANLTHSRLKAYFVEKVEGEAQPRQKLVFALPYVETITAADIDDNSGREELYAENEGRFSAACSNRGVNCQILRHRNPQFTDLVRESRYADMILLDPEISLGSGEGKMLSDTVDHLLHEAECPVMIAPYSFYGLDEILFAYDGSRSSVFAIKQFMHLFPQLSHVKFTALQILDDHNNPPPDNSKMAQLIASHYTRIEFRHLHGKASDQLLGYLIGRSQTVVVMGAYGRGLASSLFRPSTADLIVKTLNLPVFTTHFK